MTLVVVGRKWGGEAGEADGGCPSVRVVFGQPLPCPHILPEIPGSSCFHKRTILKSLSRAGATAQ